MPAGKQFVNSNRAKLKANGSLLNGFAMRVIIVSDYAYINGGQAKVSIESALGLAARGHKVVYFAAVGPADPRLAAAGVKVDCLDQGDIDTSGKLAFLVQTLWNGPARRRLSEIVASGDPRDTVVHVHAWAKAFSPSIGAALRGARCGRVYTMHEFFLYCPTGGFYNYPKAETCHLKPMSVACVTTNCDGRSYPRKIARMARHELVEWGGLSRAFTHIVTISRLQYEVSRPYAPDNIEWRRVDNPVEADDLGPKAAPGADFLYVGRVSTEKGIAHFCEAARLAGVVATIAGDGPLMAELKSTYPDARFLGWKSAAELRPLMRGARALVFPSVWYEGQPLTVYEALALGTPVIVSDACAGREAVEDGENGRWFKSADAADLARALRELGDDATAARMTAAAHERYWRAPLTLERHVAAIEAVYAEALAAAA